MFVIFFWWFAQFLLSTLPINKTLLFLSPLNPANTGEQAVPTPCGLLVLGTETRLYRSLGGESSDIAHFQRVLQKELRSGSQHTQIPWKVGVKCVEFTKPHKSRVRNDRCKAKGTRHLPMDQARLLAVPRSPTHDTEQAMVSPGPRSSSTKCWR